MFNSTKMEPDHRNNMHFAPKRSKGWPQATTMMMTGSALLGVLVLAVADWGDSE
jgi:hypothetical protein